jgi:hypothetical protein
MIKQTDQQCCVEGCYSIVYWPPSHKRPMLCCLDCLTRGKRELRHGERKPEQRGPKRGAARR